MQYEVREACTLAADAILPIIERETERARRAWTAEHHRAALQLIAEIERGLTLAGMEVRRARFADARNTIAALRGLLPPLEKLIQRRPRREAEALLASVDDSAASHPYRARNAAARASAVASSMAPGATCPATCSRPLPAHRIGVVEANTSATRDSGSGDSYVLPTNRSAS